MAGWIAQSLPDPTCWPSIGLGAATTTGAILASHFVRFLRASRARARLTADPAYRLAPELPGLDEGRTGSFWGILSRLVQMPVAALFGGIAVWYFLAEDSAMDDVRLWMAIAGVLAAAGMVFERVRALSRPYEADKEGAAMDDDPELPAFLKGHARSVTFALGGVAWAALMLFDAT